MSPLLSMTADQLQQFMVEEVPYNRALGLRVVECSLDRLSFELPYSEHLIGNPATDEMDQCAITTLIDTVCGSVVLTRLQELRRTATLDLRIDFLRRSPEGRSIRCDAECLRVSRHVAQVKALVHEGNAAEPLAVATGSFAVFAQISGQSVT